MRKIAQNAIQRVLEGIYKTVVALRKFLIKIELLSGSWQQITATRPLKSVERR